MANALLRLPRWGRLLFMAGVVFGLGLLIGGPGTPAAAQKSKIDKKAAQSTGKKTPPKTEPQLVNDNLISGFGVPDHVALINREIEKGWADNKLEPSPRCSDYEFIRRASLDIIGRIAKVSEIEQFMRDPPAERRTKLIERLLSTDNEEFPNHFANVWTNMLLTRSGGKKYHEQLHLWLYDEFKAEKRPTNWKDIVTALLTAKGETNENQEVNFILAHLGEQIPAKDWKENGRFDMVPVTSRSMRLFLGLRIQCTQCHDHPFNDEWRQYHFWGVNAFFRQVDAPKGRPMAMMKRQKGPAKNQLVLVDNPDFNTPGIVPYERRNGLIEYKNPVFLDGRKMPAKATNRREELAKLVVSSDYFAKAFVNRTWGHFMGRSFTKDPDDFGEHSPASHPALLDKLAKDWATKYNHDPRVLIRWICNSRAYSLSSVANATNDKSDAEPFFSRMLLKAMTPEQLFDSLMTATQAKVGQNKDTRKKLQKTWLDRLIVNFGDDEGSEGSFNGTVVQALLMMNGDDINKAISDKENGTVAAILKRKGATLRSAMRELYLAALNREPSEAEYTKILNPTTYNLHKMNPRRDPAFYRRPGFAAAFYQDMFWALLNSNEFILNH